MIACAALRVCTFGVRGVKGADLWRFVVVVDAFAAGFGG
jgi:hypothetical protein